MGSRTDINPDRMAQDLICNEVGNKWWVQDLEWQGAADWNAAPEESWTVDGEKAGTAQVAEPLSFVKVDGAGHMVRIPPPPPARPRCCIYHGASSGSLLGL